MSRLRPLIDRVLFESLFRYRLERSRFESLLKRYPWAGFLVAAKALFWPRVARHLGIVLLAVLVFGGNTALALPTMTGGNGWLLPPPEEQVAVIEKVAPLTAAFDEDPTLLKLTQDGLSVSVEEALSAAFVYVVSEGDTLARLAKKFNLHVATILEANNLSAGAASHLTVGQRLVIPAYDTSESLAWLAYENQVKEEKRQAEEARRAKERRLAGRGLVLAQTAGRADEETPEAGGGFLLPVRHKGISRGISRFHHGIDYRADFGTPVVAAAAGRVVLKTKGFGQGFGLSILIDHGGGRTSRYAHLSGFAVSEGEWVLRGQVIGFVGSTGFSTGSHLHFEVQQAGRVVRPF